MLKMLAVVAAVGIYLAYPVVLSSDLFGVVFLTLAALPWMRTQRAYH